MRYIDLSHTMKNQMPIYPGDKTVEIMTKDYGCDVVGNTLHCSMHNGTHIDAPGHMVPGGKNIADVPVDTFIGAGTLLDVRGKKQVSADVISGITLLANSIVLIYTGYSDMFHSKEYFETYPSLTEDFAQEFIKAGVKMVGMDTPSPDYAPYGIHKMLFRHDILIIENLTGLDQLVGKTFDVIALPINIEADGALARVIARIS